MIARVQDSRAKTVRMTLMNVLLEGSCAVDEDPV